MQELESLLASCEMSVIADFDHLKHRIWCYAHIINICLSHIILSMMSVSKQYLSELKVPIDSKPMVCDDSEDESDGGDINPNYNFDELELDDCYNAYGESNFNDWFADIRCNPLRCAHRIIYLLCSLDQCRKGFYRFIQDGNKRNWFSEKTQSGKRHSVQVPLL